MNEIDLKILPINMQPNSYGSGFKNHRVAVAYVTKALPTVARVALSMAERWGLVACAPDGEDSAGRQRARMQSAEELAENACNTASALWKKFGERGWLIDLPDPIKIDNKVDETVD